jgi:hypothetical protein
MGDIPLRCRRGFTQLETITSVGLSVLVLTGATALYFAGMFGWARGQGKIDAETGAQSAVRIVAKELREAMSVTVDVNGQGLTYVKPALDNNGNFVIPPTADGVTRRIEFQNSPPRLVMLTNGTPRVLCRGVQLTDPSAAGNPAYTIFAPGAGAVTRSITIMLVSRRETRPGQSTWSRSRESVFLRNVPELMQ